MTRPRTSSSPGASPWPGRRLAAAGLVALLAACQSAPPPVTPPPDPVRLLAAALPFATGAATHSVVAVDLFGNGILDLVAAVSDEDAVAVLVGSAPLEYDPPVLLATGGHPKHVAVADLDGDGQLDLVVANDGAADDQHVSLILRLPDGGFAPAAHVEACANPHQVAVGDFDGDGHADLAVVCWSGDAVAVLFGHGDGTFEPHVAVPSGGEALHAVVVGDLDGDGIDDVAAVGLGTSTLSVLLSNGDRTFAAPVVTSVGSSPHGLAIGDLTGDGSLDLVTANQSGHDVSVLLNDGTANFTRTDHPAGPAPKEVAIGDLDGDGRPDIVTADSHGNYPDGATPTSVSVLYGLGSGAFSAPERFPVDLTPFAVDVADLSGDGRLDVVTANWHSGDVAVLVNTGAEREPGAGID